MLESQISEYRNCVLKNIKLRNGRERDTYNGVFTAYEQLFTKYKIVIDDAKIKNESLHKLQIEVQNLRNLAEASELDQNLVKDYEKKLAESKEETIRMQKTAFENAQSLLSTNDTVKALNADIEAKHQKIRGLEEQNNRLVNENHFLKEGTKAVEEVNALLKEEKEKSVSNYNLLNDKYRQLDSEFQQVLAQLLKAKDEVVELLNIQNKEAQEKMLREKNDKSKIDSGAAASNKPANEGAQPGNDFNKALDPFKNILSNLLKKKGASVDPTLDSEEYEEIKYTVTLPAHELHSFECDDGEVNVVKYHKSGKYFATGGSDKKIKLWDYRNRSVSQTLCLIGSRSSIASIDIFSESNLIAGGSSNHACFWNLNDKHYRMLNGDFQSSQTLTGHSEKVTAVKFLTNTKLVTGSFDRTLREWDILHKSSTNTIMLPSKCYDLAVVNSDSVISGHFDKRVRLFDLRRSNAAVNELMLSGSVTSLDMSLNREFFLASVKSENMLYTIDFRMFDVVKTYKSDDFIIASDCTKCVLSPDYGHEYICGGSVDGNIVIWNRNSGIVEKVLKGHKNPVYCVAWHPEGNYLVSCDNKKKVTIWG